MNNVIKGFFDRFGVKHELPNNGSIDITALQTAIESLQENMSIVLQALDGKANTSALTNLSSVVAGKSNTGHTHTVSEMTDFQAALSEYSNNRILQFNGLYSGKSTTELTINSMGTMPANGGFLGIVNIRRVADSTMYGFVNIQVAVCVDSPMDAYMYYKGALFAHLSGGEWVVDYDGDVLVPVHVDPIPEVDTDKYVKLIDNSGNYGEFVGNGIFNFWFFGPSEAEREYAVFKRTDTAKVALRVSDGAISGSSLKIYTYSYDDRPNVNYNNLPGEGLGDAVIEVDEIHGFE